MISRCLDSVLRQTLSPNEIIIVDDGSEDDTSAIIQNYNDPRIRYLILEENRGAQAARNYGITMSQGDWIAFLDSDDEWVPQKLEKQIQYLAKVDFDPFTVVHTNAIVIETSTGSQLSFNLAFEGDNIYPDLLCNFGPMFQGMLVSYQALEKIEFLDENVPSFQEWDTAIRLAKHCKFKYLEEPLFIYYIHQADRISNDNQRWIDGYSYIIHKYKNDILHYCGEYIWKQHLKILQNRKESISSISSPGSPVEE
jgi:glycosyltransferase involved in cell wall biosynthesis